MLPDTKTDSCSPPRLICKDLSVTLLQLRHLYSNTGVDNCDSCNCLHWGVISQLCGQALLCLEKRKTVLEYTSTQLSPLFSPRYLASADADKVCKHGYHQLQTGEMWLNEMSNRVIGLPAGQPIRLRRVQSAKKHLVWQSWHWNVNIWGNH